MDKFSMFDFLGPAVIAGFFAVVYLWLVAPRLIPERQAPMSGKVSRVYTAQIRLDMGSPVVGKTLAEAILRAGEGMRVESVQRGQGVFINPLPDVVLKDGDRTRSQGCGHTTRAAA